MAGEENFRIMRLMVLFDLPVGTSAERKSYRQFRKFLIENGYLMVQYSIYAKILLNHSALGYQKKKIYDHLPNKGHVDVLVITEKQFASMERFMKPEKNIAQVHSTDRIIEL